MTFMSNIISFLNDASDFFYEIYLEVYDWPSPFWYPAVYFYYLSVVFSDLAWAFSSFSDWLIWAEDAISDILDFGDIWSYFETWFNWAEWAWDWVVDAWYNVTSIIDSWWLTMSATVQGWIDSARSELLDLYDNLANELISLWESWSSFEVKIPTLDQIIAWWSGWTGEVLSVVNSWWTGALVEVAGLIDNAFTVREGLWSGWQDWRDQVVEFFTDPEEWLYQAVDRIIERFW